MPYLPYSLEWKSTKAGGGVKRNTRPYQRRCCCYGLRNKASFSRELDYGIGLDYYYSRFFIYQGPLLQCLWLRIPLMNLIEVFFDGGIHHINLFFEFKILIVWYLIAS